MTLQVQILRRVPRQAELGQNDQRRARVPRAGDRIGDQGGVALQVSDRGVDLRERNEQSGRGFFHLHSMFKRLTDMTISPRRIGGLAVALASLALAAPAVAQDAGELPPIDPGPADPGQALDTAQATLAPETAPAGAEPTTDATMALHDVALAYPELDGADRARARSLLSRPTDGNADPIGFGYPPAAPIASAESAHFCVFWVSAPGFPDAPNLTDANGINDTDGVPDYVESIQEIAEYSRSIEVIPAR